MFRDFVTHVAYVPYNRIVVGTYKLNFRTNVDTVVRDIRNMGDKITEHLLKILLSKIPRVQIPPISCAEIDPSDSSMVL